MCAFTIDLRWMNKKDKTNYYNYVTVKQTKSGLLSWYNTYEISKNKLEYYVKFKRWTIYRI